MLPEKPGTRLLLWIVLLLPACFIVWHALASLLAAPAVYVAGELLQLWLPELIDEYSLQGTTMVLTTTYGESAGQLVPLAQAEFQVGFNQDTRLLSYSIPFFAALHFASGLDNPMERFGRGLLILWVLMVLGVIFVSLKNLMIALGEIAFTEGTLPPPAAIALLYQFSVLMVPTGAPLCLGAWEARNNPGLRDLVAAAARRPSQLPGNEA